MRSLIITLCLCLALPVFAAPEWQLKRDKDGIKIYAGSIPNSNVKAVRAESTLHCTMSQLTALLLDTKAHEKWVYSTKTSYLLKATGPASQLYYSEMSMPWPLTNRDVVVSLQIAQDAATRVLTVTSASVPGYMPEHKGIVRVPRSKATWKVTPIGNNTLKVEYIAEADPGGSIPAWIANMFCDKGPYETFKKLSELLSTGAYNNARFDFIKD
jgi:hypothetical protein